MPGSDAARQRTSASPSSSGHEPRQPAVALDVGIEMVQPAGPTARRSRALSARSGSRRAPRRRRPPCRPPRASPPRPRAPAPRDRRQAAGRSPWPSRASSAPRGQRPGEQILGAFASVAVAGNRAASGELDVEDRVERPIGQVGHLGVAALLAGRQARAQVARAASRNAARRSSAPAATGPRATTNAARHAAAGRLVRHGVGDRVPPPVRGVARQQDHAHRAAHCPLCLGQDHLGHRGRHGVGLVDDDQRRRRGRDAGQRTRLGAGIPEAGHRARAPQAGAELRRQPRLADAARAADERNAEAGLRLTPCLQRGQLALAAAEGDRLGARVEQLRQPGGRALVEGGAVRRVEDAEQLDVDQLGRRERREGMIGRQRGGRRREQAVGPEARTDRPRSGRPRRRRAAAPRPTSPATASHRRRAPTGPSRRRGRRATRRSAPARGPTADRPRRRSPRWRRRCRVLALACAHESRRPEALRLAARRRAARGAAGRRRRASRRRGCAAARHRSRPHRSTRSRTGTTPPPRRATGPRGRRRTRPRRGVR